jgi:asparagine synthetase B (glutamine-hydrolysing)
MCGFFGILSRRGAQLSDGSATGLLRDLYWLSESRGKESAGVHLYLPEAGQSRTLRGAQRATELGASPVFGQLLDRELGTAIGSGATNASALALLAHSRLATNGTAELPQNNQPARSGHVTMFHNGICVNVDALWAGHPELQRHAAVDTEALAALIDKASALGQGAPAATQSTVGAMKGAALVAWVHDQGGFATLATNTGDLYVADLLADQGYLVFASERCILTSAMDAAAPAAQIRWLEPGHDLSLDLLGNSAPRTFLLGGEAATEPCFSALARSAAQHHDTVSGQVRAPAVSTRQADESLLRYNEGRTQAMRRRSRCVLPATFPFIVFDAQGVCNYCRSYQPRSAHMHPVDTKRDFIKSLERYRRAGHDPDVLVAFSGGRDSSYGLHLIKKEVGPKPTTFTYVWGMVTDLARRNIARICGQRGIQNILVSADIAEKRRNIRLNVSGWLKKPDLGLVPLFMAVDKHSFRVVNELKRQTGIALDLWCANPLENRDPKSGFCGVSPDFGNKRVDYLSLGRKARLADYYGVRFLQNPDHLNASLKDTFGAFLSYYFELRRDFYFIFDHFTWNQDEVNRVLLSEYDWELAPDSPSTWRISDGTAQFYNYIYMTARGFTEFDTFRSNQIREGHITRERALESILVENRPRAETLCWYMDTIGLDFDTVIRGVNELNTLGLRR